MCSPLSDISEQTSVKCNTVHYFARYTESQSFTQLVTSLWLTLHGLHPIALHIRTTSLPGLADKSCASSSGACICGTKTLWAFSPEIGPSLRTIEPNSKEASVSPDSAVSRRAAAHGKQRSTAVTSGPLVLGSLLAVRVLGIALLTGSLSGDREPAALLSGIERESAAATSALRLTAWLLTLID